MSDSIRALDLTVDAIAQRVLQIQRMAYQIEAELIGFDGIPQLHESLQDLSESCENFLGFFVEDTLAGVLSYSIDKHILDIGRLVVHPDYFRRGIGKQLVQFVETIAEIERIVVSTGALNRPTRYLYEQSGYELLEEKQIVDGLIMAFYQKNLS